MFRRYLLPNLKYLAYKIANALLVRYWRFRHFQSGCLIYPKSQNNKRHLNFDFSHHTTHLGDRLFFFPVFNMLAKKGVSFSVKDPSGISQELYLAIYGTQLNDAHLKTDGVTVIPHSSLLSAAFRALPMIVVDFYHSSNIGISDLIVQSFNEYFCFSNITDQQPLCVNVKQQIKSIQENEKVVIFNNYLGSGKYRKLFLNERRLYKKCMEYKNLGYKIIHVAGRSDYEPDDKLYTFVDIDLRGELSLTELIQLFSIDQLAGIVSYDNFYMHLAGMFNKPANILFRGRFLKRNVDHHFRVINPAFFKDKTKLSYL
jgi:hypothetical protein